jgi:hypothetical protein
MSKAFSAFVLAAATIFALPSLSHATLIDFDDISVPTGTSVALTNPYAGFNWSGVDVENNLKPKSGFAAAGFLTGIVSQTNAASGLDVTFTAVTGTFTFDSGYFTKVFGGDRFGIPIPDAESITVSDNLGDSKTFTINWSGPTFETFNWAGVTTVSTDTLGTPPASYVFDDLTVSGISKGTSSAAPEPSTWAMLLIGFAGLGFAGYRASRKSFAIAG